MDVKPDIVNTARILGCLPEKREGNRYHGGQCPTGHTSNGDRCFVVYTDDQRFHCYHCGMGGDAYDLIQLAKGSGFKEAVKFAEENGLIRPGIDGGHVEGQDMKSPPTVSAVYPYEDQDGNLLYEVVRYSNKDFRQRRPDGNGSHIWKLDGVSRVPFRLPAVIQKDEIVIVEGEKDALNLEKLGFTATCNPCGACNWRAEFNQYFRGKVVAVIPDNDEPGKKHAQTVAEHLYGEAKSVKIVQLPDLPEHGDASDFIEHYHEPSEAARALSNLIERAPEWHPSRAFVSAGELLKMSFQHETPVIGRGILPAKAGMIIAGESGVGKSLFRTELAIHLATGVDAWGLEIPEPRRVLVIQSENTYEAEQCRLSKMLRGLGIESYTWKDQDHLVFVDPSARIDLTQKQDIEWVLRLIQETDSDVVIWDPLTNLHSVNENENGPMRRVLNSITEIGRETGATSIVIDHYGKPNETHGSRHRTRGASSKKDWADTLIGIERLGGSDENKIKVEFHKVRNGRSPAPLLLERTEAMLHVASYENSACSPVEVRAILQGLGGVVKEQKPLLKAIIEKANCGEKTARKYIQQAVKAEAILPGEKEKRKQPYEVNENWIGG